MNIQNKALRGVLAMVLACTIWGTFSIIFHQLGGMAPLDILSNRVLWGLVFLLIWFGIKGRLGEIRLIFRSGREITILILAALLITLNWLVFIWAVQNSLALHAGMGYFLFPIVSVLLGVVFKGEKINALEKFAVAFAAVAVCILGYGLGQVPYISLVLAITFSLYGLAKSYSKVGAALSVLIEVILLAPYVILWLVFFAENAQGIFKDGQTAFLLVLAGVGTGVALIMFSYASKNLPYASVGMLQFLNPTLQVLIAVTIFHEPILIWHKIGFPMIWIACSLYAFGLWQEHQSQSHNEGRSSPIA